MYFLKTRHPIVGYVRIAQSEAAIYVAHDRPGDERAESDGLLMPAGWTYRGPWMKVPFKEARNAIRAKRHDIESIADQSMGSGIGSLNGGWRAPLLLAAWI